MQLHAFRNLVYSFYFYLLLKEVTKTHFRVCIKDNAGYDGQRSNVIVDYLVIGGIISYKNIVVLVPLGFGRDTILRLYSQL